MSDTKHSGLPGLSVRRPVLVLVVNLLIVLGGLAALLAAGTIFSILIGRNIRTKQTAKLKERFAADLHDELGANIHTIALLGDLARRAVHSPDRLIGYLNRARVFTERSGEAARHCTNLLEADGLYNDLAADIRHTTARILGDINLSLIHI